MVMTALSLAVLLVQMPRMMGTPLDAFSRLSIIEPDPARLRPEVAHGLSLKLGAVPVHSEAGLRCYYRRAGLDKRYNFCFLFSRLSPHDYVWLGEDQPPLPPLAPGQVAYRYAVGVSPSWPERHNLNIGRFVLSAYRQEVDPAYRADAGNFLPLKPKSDSEFWFRNMINMGYGAQYVYENNPFTSNGWAAIGFGYLWEALHYIPIFGGPFLGKSTGDKVAIPLIGLGSLLFWKLAFNGWLVKAHMDEYNNLVDSGYRVPRTIQF